MCHGYTVAHNHLFLGNVIFAGSLESRSSHLAAHMGQPRCAPGDSHLRLPWLRGCSLLFHCSPRVSPRYRLRSLSVIGSLESRSSHLAARMGQPCCVPGDSHHRLPWLRGCSLFLPCSRVSLRFLPDSTGDSLGVGAICSSAMGLGAPAGLFFLPGSLSALRWKAVRHIWPLV